MRIFVGEGLFLSLVFALVFFSGYSQGLDHGGDQGGDQSGDGGGDPGEPCTGALESVGKLACDDNALCYQADGGFTCVCKDNHFGDGWAVGSGCKTGVSQDMPESRKVKRGLVGSWYSHRNIGRCRGYWAWFGRMVCVRNALCLQGFTRGMWIRCFCRSGNGNGFSTRFRGGTGCR